MEYFAVTGGFSLEGRVAVQGAKNSALPILAAALLAEGESVIHNCPDLSDVSAAMEILRSLGCKVRREGHTVYVDTTHRCGNSIPDGLMGQMRASVLFLGALLASGRQASACWPGGCALGSRPIDLHIRAFQGLGAEVRSWNGRLFFHSCGLRGRRLSLPFPSVGATENAMLAACGAKGRTELYNVAREPEIVDLQGFLRSLGAEITGAGSGCIVVQGGRPLHAGEYTVMSDRIAAATYLCAVASAGGEGEILGAESGHLLPVLEALKGAGCRIVCEENRRIWIQRKRPLRGIGTVTTGPYPGFPTDAQPMLAAVLASAEGKSRIIEKIFDHRFRYLQGLARMGASIRAEGDTAHILGSPLRGACVEATDLRGGAALVVAALGAKGSSQIWGLQHMDRGYERLEAGLQELGGRISRRTG